MRAKRYAAETTESISGIIVVFHAGQRRYHWHSCTQRQRFRPKYTRTWSHIHWHQSVTILPNIV